MNILKAFRMLKSSLPIFKSFFKAYKHVNSSRSGNESKHPFDQFFSKMMAKTNIAAPPLTQSTALQILNIEKSIEEVEDKLILERYFILYKKNDPANGGTTYLQSKINAAKDCLMSKYPDAEELEKNYIAEVIQPQQAAAKQANSAKQQQDASQADKTQKAHEHLKNDKEK